MSVTAKGSPLAPSMHRDLQRGLRIEAIRIVGDTLGWAQTLSIATPLLSAAYANLSIYQSCVANA